MKRPAERLVLGHLLGATAVSLPWPALLAQVWAQTAGDTWVGLASAGRLLPYVVLSAYAGMLADRISRSLLLRISTVLRVAALLTCWAALLTDHLLVAVCCAVAAVAVITPAYPAAVALMPGLARERTPRLTELLVTAEMTAFVVGPAIGGLLLGLGTSSASALVAAVLALVSLPLLPARKTTSRPEPAVPGGLGRLRTVLGSPGVPAAMALVSMVNLSENAASVGLLALSNGPWRDGDRGYGWASAALGFGSLAAPALVRLLRIRAALLTTGAGYVIAGVAPGAVAGLAPLAATGAAATVVECIGTDVLQRSVPDHVRAFSLGIADAAMSLAAMAGAVLAPALVGLVGPMLTFVALGLVPVAVTVGLVYRGRRRGRLEPPVVLQQVSAQAEGPSDSRS